MDAPTAPQTSEKLRDPPAERLSTAHLRQLPDFVIIGTQRGGTTSLYRYLVEHPDVTGALRKEVHFFDRYYDKGLDWYLAHFPKRGEAAVVGEASPYYLFHRSVPERIQQVLPNTTFIALLRNPVDRAYSQYHMKVARGLEPLSFEEAVDREPERLAEIDDPLDPAWRHHSYLARGVYANQVQRWLEVVPRDRLLIIKSEDLYRNPGPVLQETQRVLGLRPWVLPRFKAYHLAQYAPMDVATRRRLADYFAPRNEELYDLVGRDFGWENEN